MKRISTISMILLLLLTVALADAGEWRIPLGFTYINGVGDIHDQLEDNLEAEGFDTDTVEGFPVGLSFQPYYEFDSGFGIGGGFGPMIWVFGDADFFDLPVNLCLRYAILPNHKITPFIRAGASYHIITGDYDEDSEIGLIGGIGVEFMRDRGSKSRD